MPHDADRNTVLRSLAQESAEQWWALGLGCAACFLVLLSTKGLEGEARVFSALGAIVVIMLWLATGSFRRDGAACAVSSTLALLPIAALECGWVSVDGNGTVLLIETFCLAILFSGQLRRLGAEVSGLIIRRRDQPAHRFVRRSSTLVVRACVVLLGLLAAPSLMTAATAAVAG